MNNDRFKFRVWDESNAEYGSSFAIESNGAIWHNGCYVLQSNYIVEQCTGLTDRNGKLIYEGDILGNGNGPLRIVVVWENVYWGYYADGSFHALPFWVNKLEIVGNIHEVAD